MISKIKGRAHAKKGFTLIEVVVVLAVIATLVATLAPTLFSYIKESKMHRAQNDLRIIVASIVNFSRDTGVWPIYRGAIAAEEKTVRSLVTDGNEATQAEGITGWNDGSGTLQNLRQCLQQSLLADGTNSYKNATARPYGFRGPYLSDFKPDPWGNRYYVSAVGMHSESGETAVFGLSAGPNGTIETRIETRVAETRAANFPGGDDIIFRIR